MHTLASIKKITFLLLLIIAIACAQQDPKDQIQHLNGYWEIDRVEFSKDSLREFNFNETVDYLDLDGTAGFRKKVRPQLDGSYRVTQDAEQVEIKIEDDHLYLYYSTAFDSWKEKVLKAEENELIIENEQGIIYHYKKYIPLFNHLYETK